MTKQMTNMTSGPTRPFRFGIVAPFLSDLPTWREQVRRIADHGYSTVLMPDFPQLQPSPAAALAVAATVADVRVGTWVYAAPLRAPWLTAWEAHSLTMLTQGRFEMGIGAGRPGIEDELRERGLPVPSPGQRLELVRESVAALRVLDGEQGHTPVAMAVMGAKARALAAEIADTVTFAMTPDEPRAAVMQRVREFHTTRTVELSMHIPVVGNTVSPFMGTPAYRHHRAASGRLPRLPPADPVGGRRRTTPPTRRDRHLLLRLRRQRRGHARSTGRRTGRAVEPSRRTEQTQVSAKSLHRPHFPRQNRIT
jgi:hypothetical protein